MKHTINRLLAMEKSLRERLVQLNELKKESSRYTIFSEDKKEYPTYDVKKVDKKITDINKALFEISHKIKESNAKTRIDVDINYDELVSALE